MHVYLNVFGMHNWRCYTKCSFCSCMDTIQEWCGSDCALGLQNGRGHLMEKWGKHSLMPLFVIVQCWEACRLSAVQHGLGVRCAPLFPSGDKAGGPAVDERCRTSLAGRLIPHGLRLYDAHY